MVAAQIASIFFMFIELDEPVVYKKRNRALHIIFLYKEVQKWVLVDEVLYPREEVEDYTANQNTIDPRLERAKPFGIQEELCEDVVPIAKCRDSATGVFRHTFEAFLVAEIKHSSKSLLHWSVSMAQKICQSHGSIFQLLW
jgi:hypothetical protein